MNQYVHGYSEREADRLYDQAGSVRDLLHHDSRFAPGSRVLEAGCGVGAQTVTLAALNPSCDFVSVDLAQESLAKARQSVDRQGLKNVSFQRADIGALPFAPGSFDHVFVCFVLEHLADPAHALARLRTMLRPGGTITVIEGDHGSCFFHPATEEALAAWRCLIAVQARLGGDALIGRRLYPLLKEAGFEAVRVSPRMVYADQGHPEQMASFVAKTIAPMVAGIDQQVLQWGLMPEAAWQRGVADLHGLAERPEGTFCYTFFKAIGTAGAPDADHGEAAGGRR